MVTSHHVSNLNREKALQNINRKISLLKKWSIEGIPDTLVNGEKAKVYVPNSLRSFNAWERVSGEQAYDFVSNAADTLRNEKLLTKLVLDLIGHLEKMILKRAEIDRKPNKEKILSLELKDAKAQLFQLEKKYVVSRLDLNKSDIRLQTVLVQKENLEKECLQIKRDLEAQIRDLLVANQKLTKQLSNLSVIKK